MIPESTYLNLISVADIEAYTGVTYDSTETAVLETIIVAVISQAENYCDTEFTERLRYERLSLGEGLITPRYNVVRVNGLYIGQDEVITVTAPSFSHSLSIGEDSLGAPVILLTGPSSYTEIEIGTNTLADVMADIDAVSGWTAVAGPAYNATALAGTIWNGLYNGDVNNEFNLLAANTKVNFSKINKKVLQCSQMTNDGILFYTSGYSVLPYDLKDALIRFIIKAYTDKSSTQIGDAKSEAVGDWSITYFTPSELSTGGTLAIEYYKVLNKYKNRDI